MVLGLLGDYISGSLGDKDVPTEHRIMGENNWFGNISPKNVKGKKERRSGSKKSQTT